jgi:hypothetical protein
MTRIIPTLAPRLLSRFVSLHVLGAMLLGTSAAEAALTTDKCLVLKRQAWGNLRKCQATEQVKQLKGKPADLAKCQTKFQEKLAKVTAQAEDAAIACRYGANAVGTVTDYDTGLEWEGKAGEVGGLCFIFVDRVNHCVNATFTWADAQIFVSGVSTDGTTVSSFFQGSADSWRLPTVVELHTILDTTVPGCRNGSPCIDPIFGATVADYYWSGSTLATGPTFAWLVGFGNGFVSNATKEFPSYVRAVRAGL